VVVYAANLFPFAVHEPEDDAIRLVRANTVKAGSISPEPLPPVGGRYPQVLDGRARIQQVEFVLYPAPELASNPKGAFGVVPVIDIRSRLIAETRDHGDSIPEYPLFVYKLEVEAFHV
jgi:hypothetical protein